MVADVADARRAVDANSNVPVVIILRTLFAFLMSQGYVMGNPFEAVELPPNPQPPFGSSRTSSFAHWDHIDALLQGHVETEPGRRLRRVIAWGCRQVPAKLVDEVGEETGAA